MLRLPSAALAQMRAAAESLMTDTCTIEARRATVGEHGEPTEEFEVIETAVPCRVITLGSRFKEAQDNPATMARETQTDAYRLVVPHDTALDVDQRVTLASSGEVYDVADLLVGRTDEVDRQAIIARVR